jgi:hypothetical protein
VHGLPSFSLPSRSLLSSSPHLVSRSLFPIACPCSAVLPHSVEVSLPPLFFLGWVYVRNVQHGARAHVDETSESRFWLLFSGWDAILRCRQYLVLLCLRTLSLCVQYILLIRCGSGAVNSDIDTASEQAHRTVSSRHRPRCAGCAIWPMVSLKFRGLCKPHLSLDLSPLLLGTDSHSITGAL